MVCGAKVLALSSKNLLGAGYHQNEYIFNEGQTSNRQQHLSGIDEDPHLTLGSAGAIRNWAPTATALELFPQQPQAQLSNAAPVLAQHTTIPSYPQTVSHHPGYGHAYPAGYHHIVGPGQGPEQSGQFAAYKYGKM